MMAGAYTCCINWRSDCILITTPKNVYCTIDNRQWSVLPLLPHSTSIARGWLLQLKLRRASKTLAACYLNKCHWTVTSRLPWWWCVIQIHVLL